MRLQLAALVTATLGLAVACTPGKKDVQTPHPGSTELAAEAPVQVNLRYRRPSAFASVGRPEAFYVIADYLGASSEQQYPGSWDDRTQTLSAFVTVPVHVENLVYVVDPAVQPGATTTITAARGALKEVTCPSYVDPLYTCAVLQILH